jgi:hypothetical protein
MHVHSSEGFSDYIEETPPPTIISFNNIDVARIPLYAEGMEPLFDGDLGARYTQPGVVEYFAGEPIDTMSIFRNMNNFITSHIFNRKDKLFIISIPDLHGASEGYFTIYNVVLQIRETHPDIPIIVLFTGDFTPKYEPPAYQDISIAQEQLPGKFVSELVQPLAGIPGVSVIATLGNHEMQNMYRFLQLSRKFQALNVPFLSNYTPWMRKNWENIINEDSRYGDGTIGNPMRSETHANYKLPPETEDPSIDLKNFTPTQDYAIMGNIAVIPHTTAFVSSGGEYFPSEGFTQHGSKPFTKYLEDIIPHSENNGTRDVEMWDYFEKGAMKTIANNFREALTKLNAQNPPDEPLNIVIASHATNKQTRAYLKCLFACIRENDTDNSFLKQIERVRFIILGGHDHGPFMEEMSVGIRGDTPTNDIIFCASDFMGASINLSIVDFTQPPAEQCVAFTGESKIVPPTVEAAPLTEEVAPSTE